MAHDPGDLELELDEARAAHAKLVAQIEVRMRQLDELWRVAKAADRLLAVQRLVQTGALADDVAGALDAKNERVRDLMARVRTERKKTEKNVADGIDDHDQRHKVFLLELDLQRAEQERDELVDEHDLRGPLYVCGETFVRTEPFASGESPLKDMAARAKHYEERVAELEQKAPRRGAKFIKKDAQGREKTLIRMLPALTMEADSEQEPVS
jgi:hypothetical protein